MLNMFKSPAPATIPPPPVVAHTTISPAPPPQAEPQPEPEQSPVPAPQPQAPIAVEVPQKSIFDFVSPFDAFEKPIQTRKIASLPSAQNGTKGTGDTKAAPAVEKSNGVPKPFPTTTAVAVSKESLESLPSSTSTSKSKSRDGQRSDSPAGKGHDLGLVWQVEKATKGVEGRGPVATPAHIVIDISKGNIESLVNTPGTVQISPATLRPAEHIAHTTGRSVALTAGWMAYGLKRGKIRLIDRTSGARLAIQLPSSASGSILDLAATPTSIAIVGSDHSVHIYQVPATWEVDDPATIPLLNLAALGPQVGDDTIGKATRVEWVRRDGEPDALIIGGNQGVIIVPVDEWKGRTGLSIHEVVGKTKVLKTNGILVDFALNHSSQAVGLLSASSHFTLYSVATLARVWHRVLPTAFPSLTNSSVTFCESNILVGKANDTAFDLVQITLEMAVLSSIRLNAPAPSP
ncbi:hypothetical protein P7C73_g6833, partial [Tremellales sp. Uapishka_1]